MERMELDRTITCGSRVVLGPAPAVASAMAELDEPELSVGVLFLVVIGFDNSAVEDRDVSRIGVAGDCVAVGCVATISGGAGWPGWPGWLGWSGSDSRDADGEDRLSVDPMGFNGTIICGSPVVVLGPAPGVASGLMIRDDRGLGVRVFCLVVMAFTKSAVEDRGVVGAGCAVGCVVMIWGGTDWLGLLGWLGCSGSDSTALFPEQENFFAKAGNLISTEVQGIRMAGFEVKIKCRSRT